MTDRTRAYQPMPQSQDVRQVPDPTTLAVLQREVSALKELIFTRLDAMDKAIVLFNDNLTRAPTEVDKQIAHLKELHEEKFRSVQLQFHERDVRVEQTARDTKTAVDAALAAQEKSAGKQVESFVLSIGKSEAATTKQIDQLGVLLQQNTKASDEKISDIKERLTLIEGQRTGGINLRTAAVGVLLAFAALVGVIINFVRSQ